MSRDKNENIAISTFFVLFYFVCHKRLKFREVFVLHENVKELGLILTGFIFSFPFQEQTKKGKKLFFSKIFISQVAGA